MTQSQLQMTRLRGRHGRMCPVLPVDILQAEAGRTQSSHAKSKIKLMLQHYYNSSYSSVTFQLYPVRLVPPVLLD